MNIKSLVVGVTCLSLMGSLTAQTVAKKPVKPVVINTITFEPIPDSVTATSATIAAYLKTHRSDQAAILKSLYGWMGNNISYDMVNTFKPDYYTDTVDAINKTLKTRTAICHGYASLFMDVSRRAGIPAWLVSGYPITAGKPDNASHMWVAVFTANKWQLIDPTWGSGYANNNKFVRHLNWEYFLVSPAVFIKTHVPFDPLFQFQDHPLRHDEVRDGKWTAGSARPIFNYLDTLAAYTTMSEKDRAQNAANRIAQYGISNQLISVELTDLRNIIANAEHNEQVDAYNKQVGKINKASSLYNEVTNSFNQYVVFKNNQYTPAKTDKEIREWVDGMATQLDDIDKLLQTVTATEPSHVKSVGEIKTAIGGLRQRITEEQAFVTKYIKTGKLFRKGLFYKMNWK
ncbi:MAG: hypothetical protein J7623_04085 [Chitinophaga sp.]|uniref:transglutaminase domain-containing protein n=1 Tax=Chitinophaga sp. TaxID=1869181 RepID=UPI001AFE238F|nr:transglutaminase domain-containing protein [Chitinophaga sp.]MBO9727801.1 hypothetical protein [Chitinophaga sp.]